MKSIALFMIIALINAAEERVWLVDTEMQLHEMDGKVRHVVNWRLPCNANVSYHVNEFCKAKVITEENCKVFHHSINAMATKSSATCEQRLNTIPTYLGKFDVIMKTDSIPFIMEFHAYEGDIDHTFFDRRMNQIFDQRNIHRSDREELLSYVRQQIQDLELSTSKNSVEKVIESLQARIKNLVEESREKSRAYGALLDSKRREIHKLKRNQSSSLQNKNNILPIPRFKNSEQLSYQKYLELANSSVPFILENQAAGVPDWTLEYISSICSDSVVKLSIRNDSSGSSNWARISTAASAKIKDFISDIKSNKDGWPNSMRDLYLHDMSISKHCPALLRGFSYPSYFRDYLQRTSSYHRNYWPSLFIGNKNTASGVHGDWASTAAWMGLVAGRKRWVLSSPKSRPFLYEGSGNRFNATDLRKISGGESTYEGVLEAGEIIFIPAECPHQVENLEDQTIAVAANYVDAVNIKQFRESIYHEMIQAGDSATFREYKTLLSELRTFPSYEDIADIFKFADTDFITYDEFKSA